MRQASGLALALLLLATASGCKSQPRPYQGFMHRFHRERYAVEAAEFEKIDFLISERVLVHDEQVEGGPRRVIVIEPLARGKVQAVGDDWLIVSFAGGPGIPFLTDFGRKDDLYWLATEIEGKPGFHKLGNQEDRTIFHADRRYRVLEGAFTHLLVDSRQWKELVDERIHVWGEPPPGQADSWRKSSIEEE